MQIHDIYQTQQTSIIWVRSACVNILFIKHINQTGVRCCGKKFQPEEL